MKAKYRMLELMIGFIFFLVLIMGLSGECAAASSKPGAKQSARQLDISRTPFTKDFDQMLERRVIRVLVPYSRSLYFNDNGHEMGITAENVRDFERWINRKYAKTLARRPVTVLIIPTTRDKLLPEVVSGLGDIAVGNLTMTAERLKTVDFVAPAKQPGIRELIVTGPKSPAIASTDDLADKTVHVRKASSYYESLNELNARFKKERKSAVKLVLVPDALEDEDLMEMVNAGILEIIVVDDWKAKMWAQILPKIKVNQQAVARESGKTGWAIRKGSPKLEAEILDFAQNHLQKQGLVAIRLKKYMSRVKQIKDPTGASEWKRFEEILALFRKYGQQYDFDPLMLAAQGYQESQLNQKAKSRSGAIGVMQLLPSTGKELKVGDISITEPNIHAGAKYMDRLMTKYFPDAKFTGNNRTLFAFASYNCGPGKIAAMRKEAERRGFDPNQWLNNVEVVTAEKVGMETTTYVRNIFKYYSAYRLQLDAIEEAKKARKQVVPR